MFMMYDVNEFLCVLNDIPALSLWNDGEYTRLITGILLLFLRRLELVRFARNRGEPWSTFAWDGDPYTSKCVSGPLY